LGPLVTKKRRRGEGFKDYTGLQKKKAPKGRNLNQKAVKTVGKNGGKKGGKKEKVFA